VLSQKGGTTQQTEPARSAADRVALLIVPLLALPDDTKTVGCWAHAVFVSGGSLRGYCRAAQLSPKRALDFARLLRAILRAEEKWEPWQWLNVSDPRHLKALFKRAGLSETRPCSLADFLRLQTLVCQGSAVLACIIDRLKDRHFDQRIGLPRHPAATLD
jgi:hypothetical protein